MRYAIVSDIHANRQAWASVLADIEIEGADLLVCLGDIIGYGPMPAAVLESVREGAAGVVLGNHDAAVCGRMDASIFNDHARTAIEWTRDHLDEEALRYLEEVPLVLEEEEILFVHAEVIEPGRFDYILEPGQAAENLIACSHRIVFVGHTHHPAVFVLKDDLAFELPDDDFELEEDRRYLVNVGSVGEPRDPDDLRGRYVIFDSDTGRVTFRRVAFDTAGYRADLEREGLGIRPFFLQMIDHESGAREEPVVPQAPAMQRVPMVPVKRSGQAPRELITPVRARKARPPGAAPPKPDRAAAPAPVAESLSGKPGAKEKRRLSASTISIIVAVLLLGLLIPIARRAMRGSDGAASAKVEKEKVAVAAASDPPSAGSMADLVARETGSAPPPAPPPSPKPKPKSKPKRAANPSSGPKPGVAKPAPPKPAAAVSQPFAEGLLSYWSGDKDLSVTRGSLKPAPAPVAGPKTSGGRFGRAMNFGARQGVTYGAAEDFSLEGGALTVCFWYQPTKPGAEFLHLVGTMSPRGKGDKNGWSLYANKSEFGVMVGDGEGAETLLAKNPIPNPNRVPWRHLAAVIDLERGRVTLFRDGKHAGQKDLAEFKGVLPAAHPLTVGLDPDGDPKGGYWGRIDDLALWSRALTGAEIAEIHRVATKNKKALSYLLNR